MKLKIHFLSYVGHIQVLKSCVWLVAIVVDSAGWRTFPSSQKALLDVLQNLEQELRTVEKNRRILGFR